MHSTLRKNMPEKNRKTTGKLPERARKKPGKEPETYRKPTGKCGRVSARTPDLSRRLRDGVFAFTHSGYPLCRYGDIPTNDHHALFGAFSQ